MYSAFVLTLSACAAPAPDASPAPDAGRAGLPDGRSGDAREPTDARSQSPAWIDPYGPMPSNNLWNGSARTEASGIAIDVRLPAGDTASAPLVIGGYYVRYLSPQDGAIAISIQGIGTEPLTSPGTCGSLSGVPHIPSAQFAEVLHEAGARLRFDHRRVLLEADGNNAGWAIAAGLDPANQPYVTGIYTGWCEYNQCPIRSTLVPANAGSPKLYTVGPGGCDHTYCPWIEAATKVETAGYDIAIVNADASCPCDACAWKTDGRPHTRGPGPSGGIKPWVLAQSR